MEGDRKRGSRSLALLKGRQFALRVALLVWSLVIPLSVLPGLLGWLGPSYLIGILISDGLLVFFAVRLWRSRNPAAGRQAMRGAYLGATLGVVAFLAGQFMG